MIRQVASGLDRLVEQDFAPLKGMRFGVLVNQTSVDSNFTHCLDLIAARGDLKLARIFTPEHGLFAHAQDQIAVEDDPADQTAYGCEVVSLYGDRFESLWPDVESLQDLDCLLVDLQDIGSRYYTYATTVGFCLERAARVGCKVLLLDRPNPLGGDILEGPELAPEMRSFVGWYPLIVRHGMTLGELARFIVSRDALDLDLEILQVQGWDRSARADELSLPWVLPSPNMPTLDTATVYPGGCLLEGTNLSEGRGTTRPFELFGSPSLDNRELKRRIGAEGLPGVAFRLHDFEPTFHKYAGRLCHGLQVHVTDAARFRSWLTYTLLIAHASRLDPNFDWRRETYEFVSDRLAIDLLFGSPKLRVAIEAGEGQAFFAETEAAAIARFAEQRSEFLIY